MLRIDNTIFSFDILEKKFRCDLPKCLGNCCRYGDAGAPLSAGEVEILDNIWDDVKPYLRPEGIASIEEKGTSVKDFENESVTTLIGNEECAYTVYKGNMLMCGIEQAWFDGKVTFRKPLSCHLFPVRIKNYSDFRAVNYEELAICSHARITGEEEGLYVYEFLKEPLTRALGENLYKELCIAAKELRKNNTLKK
ncbi:MAG TPA: DUF3109 family protein [Bacteroidales bacterium]|nr:DUF3109 family protein [Bacteroidales bacterium]HPT22669.1 DUF3109 family protein [Bacteroidales bacterium]